MRIRTLQHEVFDEKCYKLNVFDYNVRDYNHLAFISIIGTSSIEGDEELLHWFQENHDNVLNLEFDDITEDLIINGVELHAMSDEQAIQCVDFIEKNIGKDFYIHCRAGVSRSGAVSQFICDIFRNQVDIEDFRQNNGHIRPNNHVLTILKRAFYQKNGMFECKK